MPNIVRQNQKITGRIQWLPRVEEFASEFRPQEIAAIPGSPMKNQDGILHQPSFIEPRSTQGPVMHSQFRQNLPRLEMKIM